MWVVLRDLEKLLVQRAIVPGELLQDAPQPPVLVHHAPQLRVHVRRGGVIRKGIEVKEVNLGWRTKWRRRTTRRRLMISSTGFGVSFLQAVKNITPLREV